MICDNFKDRCFHVTVNPSLEDLKRQDMGEGDSFEVGFESMINKYKDKNYLNLRFLIVNIEQGVGGKKHLHICVMFHKKMRKDNVRRHFGNAFKLEDITPVSVKVQFIKNNDNLYRCLAYDFKDINKEEGEEIWTEWFLFGKDKHKWDKMINSSLEKHLILNQEAIIWIFNWTIDKERLFKECQNYQLRLDAEGKYRALPKVKFFELLMIRYAQREKDDIVLLDCLEEIYKEGIYLKDLAPKFVFHNMKFIVGEESYLAGFDLSVFEK